MGARAPFKAVEQYALMLPRGDADMRLAVNRVLARLYRSREIEEIYQRSLGPLGTVWAAISPAASSSGKNCSAC